MSTTETEERYGGVIKQVRDKTIDQTTYGYATEYLHVDGEPFSFEHHNYLIDMYLDDHPYTVIEKSAQMGASVYAMAKAFRVCDKMGKNVIYFFPTDSDVLEFSRTRVGPMIKDSPHLIDVTGAQDSLGLRSVGRAWLYFRGMKSQIAMKSIPADFLVFDELDEVSPKSEALADQRLNHSLMKWRLKLSTPTFEGFGIDREFQKSDQRYWNLVCKKCTAFNVLEDTFPDCVKTNSDGEFFIACRRCSSPLDSQYGTWVAKHPEITDIRGYHICGLYSYYISLKDIMREYNSGYMREEFFRSKLGIPYTSTNQRITRGMVLACQGDYENAIVSRHTYMGVDQKGDELHISIGWPDKIEGKDHVSFIGKVTRFEDLDEFMRRYDVNTCVIDGTPNQHSARDFAARFPNRVFLCYYSENQKGDYKWSEPGENDQDDWKVDVNRTEALDAAFEKIALRGVVFPKNMTEEFIDQLTHLARVFEEDDDGNILRAYWKRIGADHFAHANSYRMIAQSRFGNITPGAIMVTTKKAATRLAYSRNFEMGSRF